MGWRRPLRSARRGSERIVSNLPPLPADFHWSRESWGAALRCGPLAAIAQHGFTTRQLSLRGGPVAVPDAWTHAVALAGVPLARLARVTQVHGRHVRVLERHRVDALVLADVPEADAVVSNEPGLALAVQVADCVPILLADQQAGVAAAVHAGWRGTAAGIAGEAVGAMAALGASPARIVAAIGPSIAPCCYEVGEELVEAFVAAGHVRRDVDRWFSRVSVDHCPGGSLRLDVAQSNIDQLEAAGVRRGRIHACGLCTQTHRDVFDSYRADGASAGRMVAVVGVPGIG